MIMETQTRNKKITKKKIKSQKNSSIIVYAKHKIKTYFLFLKRTKKSIHFSTSYSMFS